MFIFIRILRQSQASSNSIDKVISRLLSKSTNQIIDEETINLISSYGIGTEGENLEKICSYIMTFDINFEIILNLQKYKYLENEIDTRYEKLKEILIDQKSKKQKAIVFAGFPGLALELRDKLNQDESFGPTEFRVFLTEEETNIKETNVSEFKNNKNINILVSDESGGEGRNFQFVDLIIHYDLPWQISPIEQRIGRLDRLKREDFSDEVLSKVIINKFSKERDLLNCYKTGFKVFEMSISGLEFVIKNVEDEIIEISIDEDNNKLTQFAETICENVENERNIDLNQQILSDEASFRGSFKNFNYENSEKLEMDLEDKFLNFYNSFHQKYCIIEHL